jgi:hypothetical protein
MPHSASKSQASPIHDLPIIAGLVCGHPDCGALFSDLDDSIVHADNCHAGTLVVNTCAIQEVIDVAGEVNLVLVRGEPDQDGEWFPNR